MFNTVCQCMGRGESGIHWDDWMEQEHRIYPMLRNDDLHSDPEDPSSGRFDYYRGWTMARVKDRSAESILEALKSGATYGSTGPEIHDIQSDPNGAEFDKKRPSGRRGRGERFENSRAFRPVFALPPRGTKNAAGPFR